MGSSAVDRSREVGQRSREGPARAYWTPCSPALRLATRQLRLPADQPGRRHRPLPAPKAQQDHRETRPVLAPLIKVCWSRRPSAEIPRSRSASRIASSVQRTSAPPGAAEALPLRPPRRRSQSGRFCSAPRGVTGTVGAGVIAFADRSSGLKPHRRYCFSREARARERTRTVTFGSVDSIWPISQGSKHKNLRIYTTSPPTAPARTRTSTRRWRR